MEAPRDTKVLLELYEEAELILKENPGTTMMVHCSAGVGRTGTFIGLFKLVKDFEDNNVQSYLDPTLSVYFTLYPRLRSWIRLRPW